MPAARLLATGLPAASSPLPPPPQALPRDTKERKNKRVAFDEMHYTTLDTLNGTYSHDFFPVNYIRIHATRSPSAAATVPRVLGLNYPSVFQVEHLYYILRFLNDTFLPFPITLFFVLLVGSLIFYIVIFIHVFKI